MLPSDTQVPYLQYYPSHQGLIRRIPLERLPFIIGRAPESNFVVPSPHVSKQHAEILLVGNEYQVRDLSSTNGTFVNGRPIAVSPLANNSIIQVAHEEFRFVCVHEETATGEGSSTQPFKGKMPISVVLGMQHLKELLLRASYRILFQPIVSLDGRAAARLRSPGTRHPQRSEHQADRPVHAGRALRHGPDRSAKR